MSTAHGTMRVNLPKEKIECPGCGRRPGKRHAADCRTAPCPKCGKPRATCGCRTTARQAIWAGVTPAPKATDWRPKFPICGACTQKKSASCSTCTTASNFVQGEYRDEPGC